MGKVLLGTILYLLPELLFNLTSIFPLSHAEIKHALLDE